MVTYTTDIPFPTNTPAQDQPNMRVNTNSISTIIAVDHIGFNVSNGGNHNQVHLPAFQSPSVVNGTGTQGSVIYSAAGVASNAYAQAQFKNDRNIAFPMSLIKAYGVIDGAAGGIVSSQSVNVTSAVRNSTGNYTVTMPANVVESANYGVIIGIQTSSAGGSLNISSRYYTLTTTTFNIQITTGGLGVVFDPVAVSFIVLQI